MQFIAWTPEARERECAHARARSEMDCSLIAVKYRSGVAQLLLCRFACVCSGFLFVSLVPLRCHHKSTNYRSRSPNKASAADGGPPLCERFDLDDNRWHRSAARGVFVISDVDAGSIVLAK